MPRHTCCITPVSFVSITPPPSHHTKNAQMHRTLYTHKKRGHTLGKLFTSPAASTSPLTLHSRYLNKKNALIIRPATLNLQPLNRKQSNHSSLQLWTDLTDNTLSIHVANGTGGKSKGIKHVKQSPAAIPLPQPAPLSDNSRFYYPPDTPNQALLTILRTVWGGIDTYPEPFQPACASVHFAGSTESSTAKRQTPS